MKLSEYKDKTVRLREFCMEVNHRRVDQIRRELNFNIERLPDTKEARRLILLVDMTNNIVECLRNGDIMGVQRLFTELKFKGLIME